MVPLVKVAMPDRKLLMPALEEVLYSGMIAEGNAVYRFESEFGRQFGLHCPVAMSSGTACLHTALTLAGVRAGDEVISTPMTAEPTNTSILYCGARPVWADVDPRSGNMDPESISQRITHRTKAIVCVHYAGYPARLDELKGVANRHGLPLIEDCAHALGATYNGRPIGTIGSYGIYSFQAIKHMTTVDGGLLELGDAGQLEAAKKIRWFGMLKGVPRTELDIASIGYKYNMNNVAATIGLVQLGRIATLIGRHKANGRFFDAEFAEIPGLDFARTEPNASSSYWVYTLLSDHSNDIEKALNAAGVMASKLHRPNNLHSIFQNREDWELPGLERFYKRLLHIPCGWWVDDETRLNIVDVIRQG